jgi:arylsulfatase A-like enzyme
VARRAPRARDLLAERVFESRKGGRSAARDDPTHAQVRGDLAGQAPIDRRRSGPRLIAAGAVVAATVALATALGDLGSSRAEAAPARPNIVVLLTDDQEPASMRVMKTVSKELKRKGVTMKRYYNNFPLCCPSRTTLLTGQYAHNHRVLSNQAPDGGYGLFNELHGDNNLAVWLQEAGYATSYVGKFLNEYAQPDEYGTLPRDVPDGWDDWRVLAPSNAQYFGYTLNQNGRLTEFGEREQDYSTDVFTTKAKRFIRRSSQASQPFFLTLGYAAPHGGGGGEPGRSCNRGAVPAPRDLGTLKKKKKGALPTSFNEADVSDKPRAVRRLPKLSAPEIADVTRKYRCALGSLLSVDDGVDRVLSRLKAKGELARTYVIFTSDNGFLNGEHRLPEGKVKPYEESIRVPLLIRGPGIPRGKTAKDLAINADLAPTITKLTGATPGLSMDGQSLFPAAVHPRTERGRELLLEAGDFRGIRTQRYVYVEHKAGARELYDLDRDPYELRNVASGPAYANVKAKLSERLRRLNRCRGGDCHTRPRVKLRLGYEPRRKGGRECAANPIRARVEGRAAGNVVKTEYYLGGKRLGEDDEPPFLHVMPPSHGPTTIGIRVTMLDGRRMSLTRTIRACG